MTTQSDGAELLDDARTIDPEQIDVWEGLGVVGHLIRPHRLVLAVSIVGSLMYALASVVGTVVLARVVDDVVLPSLEVGAEEPPRRDVWLGVGAILAVALIRSTGVVCRRYFAGMTSERVQRRTRGRLADEYLDRPASWVRAQPQGRLLAHVDSDTRVLVESLHPLPFSVAVVFIAVFSGIALVLVDPFMAGIAFVVFPLVTMVNRWYSSRVQEPMAETQERVGHVSSIAHESFGGSLIVKALGLADREHRRFDAASAQLQDARVRVGFLRAFVDAALDVLPVFGTLVAILVSAFRVRAGAMSAGEVVQVAALFSLLSVPVRVFGFFLESLAPSVVAWRRLSSLIAGEPSTPTPVARHGTDRSPASVSLASVSYQHADAKEGSRPAIDNLSLTIEPGEIVAIVGRTGAAKSTLCLLLAGLLQPTKGRITSGGVPPTLAFQEAFLFADTLRSNIDLAEAYSDAEVFEAARAAQISTFIDQLPIGYDTVMGERGVTLSGGQRQRVALARALLVDQGLLIIDDATSAVDPVIEQRILNGIRSAGSSTVVLTAHRLSTIRLADRVLFLRAGQLVAFLPHDELLADDDYRSLVMAYADE